MYNRRDFFREMGAMALIAGMTANEAYATSPSDLPKKITILFQGDSITDGNRTRNEDWNHVMGHGYAYTIASKLWYEYPDKGFYFLNRGVSGNQVTDLEKRWEQETIELKPDWLSILVGINETGAFMRGDITRTPEQFETKYRDLLKRTKEKLPQIQLILGEPFVLPVGKVKERWETYRAEVDKRSAIVKQLSEEFNAIFIPYQSAFDAALSKAPADYWIWDGIHPMPAGHELMARLWLEKVGPALGI